MDRRKLLAGVAMLPLAACGGSFNLQAVTEKLQVIPEQVARVAAVVEEIGAGLQGGLVPFVQSIPAVAQVTELIGTINAAVAKVRTVSSAVAASPIISQVTGTIAAIYDRVKSLGGPMKSLVEAALSLIPELESMVGINRPGRRTVFMSSSQAHYMMRAAAAQR